MAIGKKQNGLYWCCARYGHALCRLLALVGLGVFLALNTMSEFYVTYEIQSEHEYILQYPSWYLRYWFWIVGSCCMAALLYAGRDAWSVNSTRPFLRFALFYLVVEGVALLVTLGILCRTESAWGIAVRLLFYMSVAVAVSYVGRCVAYAFRVLLGWIRRRLF